MSLSKFIKRKRASTKAILGADYVENVTNLPELPEPPKNTSGYSEERLKLGLQYADKSLRHKTRKISPTAQHCLDIYKSTVKAVLENEYADEDERKLLLSNILMCEKHIYTKRFLHGDESVDQDLVARLAELRQYEFAARYGDYLANVCSQLKETARMQKTKYFEQLTGWQRYWTTIQDDIHSERSKWRQWERGSPLATEEDVKNTWAVFHACKHMGINFEDTIRTIGMYADRNSLVHNSFMQLVESSSWWILRETLARDLNDLPLVIPADLRSDIPLLQTIIASITDSYFERNEKTPDEYHLWKPKDEICPLFDKIKKSHEEKATALLAERQRIEKLAAERCRKLVNEHSMVHLTATAMKITPPVGALPSSSGSKRAFSETEKHVIKEKHKRQKKAWDTLVRLQSQCYKKSINYKNEFGSTEAPVVDAAAWLDLLDEDAQIAL